MHLHGRPDWRLPNKHGVACRLSNVDTNRDSDAYRNAYEHADGDRHTYSDTDQHARANPAPDVAASDAIGQPKRAKMALGAFCGRDSGEGRDNAPNAHASGSPCQCERRLSIASLAA